MKYLDPSCAYCPPKVKACRQGEGESRGPGFCPTKVDQDGIDAAVEKYGDPETQQFSRISALVESEGYCKWTRVEEICQFAKKMGYEKIGIATCISFVDQALVFSRILESHGFDVVSVACKHGGVPKEDIGVRDDQKIRPGQHESMCNPISQAEMLNNHGCQFNVVMGLCVGHDSLFFRHSRVPVTTLVVKDRVLAHNPIGALHLADTYFSRVWGPEKPEKASPLPAEGRRSG